LIRPLTYSDLIDGPRAGRCRRRARSSCTLPGWMGPFGPHAARSLGPPGPCRGGPAGAHAGPTCPPP